MPKPVDEPYSDCRDDKEAVWLGSKVLGGQAREEVGARPCMQLEGSGCRAGTPREDQNARQGILTGWEEQVALLQYQVWPAESSSAQ